MDRYILGIDVGTTGTKTLLFRQDGKLAAHAYQAYPMYTPAVGFSEQEASDWWQAVCATVRQVCEGLTDPGCVAAISLSVQGGTLIPVDHRGEPVCRAVVWNDIRCAVQKEAYLREVGEADTMYEKTGWRLGNGLLPMQIRWMKDNTPELFAKTAMFLSVPDYISLKMTGIPAVDLSNVGINQLGDIRRGQYDEDLLRFAGITEKQLPAIAPSGEVIGKLTAEAAEELGLTTETVLVSGAHDQYAVALGAGAVHDGAILIGSGTCWVVTAIGDAPSFETGLSQSVSAVPGKWGSLRSLSSGGVCLEWWRRNLTVLPDGSEISFEEINTQAAARKAAEEGLFFFPFAGYAPGGSFKKASFLGMDLSHDRFHLARAIMEGVVFQVLFMMESFRTKPSRDGIILAGGGSKSPLWRQLLADISGLPVRIPEVADMACVGAAVLAGTGCGLFPDLDTGCRTLAVEEKVILPDPARTAVYRPLYEQYKRCAQALLEAYNGKEE